MPKPPELPPSFPPPKLWPAVVLLQPMPDIGDVPLRSMALGIGEALSDDFGDATLVMLVEPGRGTPSIDTSRNPATVVVKVSTDWVKASNRVIKLIKQHGLNFAYTLIDASAMGGGFIDHLQNTIGDAGLNDRLHRRLVQIGKVHPGSPPPLNHVPDTWTVLRTELLTEPQPTANLRRRDTLSEMGKRAMKRLRRDGRESRAEAYPDEPVRTELVRVRMTYTQDTAVGNYSLWGRAVTNRRVGLALGGSGAWGYAHAALINRLTLHKADVSADRTVHDAFMALEGDDIRVPVDMIASASSGSLIGSYYAVLGNEGLDIVINNGARYGWAMAGSVITSLCLEASIAVDTGFVPLDQLETMFFPVTTNLTHMEPEFVTRSDVPWAVRASATAPGAFASTLSKDAIYVDGAIGDNVPATLVDWLGADLVFATNPLPPPDNMRVNVPPNPIVVAFKEFAPFFRFRQLLSSFALMFHKVGEYEANQYILYDPPPDHFPLMGTFDFADARQIYLDVLKEPEFNACVAQCKYAWTLLAQPRTGE